MAILSMAIDIMLMQTKINNLYHQITKIQNLQFCKNSDFQILEFYKTAFCGTLNLKNIASIDPPKLRTSQDLNQLK